MLALKELQTIRKVLEQEFKLSSEYVLFQNIVREYGLSHSEKQVSVKRQESLPASEISLHFSYPT